MTEYLVFVVILGGVTTQNNHKSLLFFASFAVFFLQTAELL